jgi:hypothetical protein
LSRDLLRISSDRSITWRRTEFWRRTGNFLLNLRPRSLADRDTLGVSLRGLCAWRSSGQQAPGHSVWPCALLALLSSVSGSGNFSEEYKALGRTIPPSLLLRAIRSLIHENGLQCQRGLSQLANPFPQKKTSFPRPASTSHPFAHRLRRMTSVFDSRRARCAIVEGGRPNQ